MTLEEIKIESLNVMFAGNGENINSENLKELENQEEYGDYIRRMTGAINRCLSDIEVKRILPLRRCSLDAEKGDSIGAYTVFDLAGIEDFFDVERVTYLRGDRYDGDLSYKREGSVIMIRNFEEEAQYNLLYRPSVRRLGASADNTTEIDIPYSIACYIPYFVKGELFREDEPDEAGEARNWYEAAMAAFKSGERTDGRVSAVRSVYDISEV